MPPKKPKLTAEEKKQLKKEKKAEKKRLAELKKKQQKHDYLGREIKYGALTVKRHEKNWRQMLLNITVPRMKEDLEYAWHNFERIIDAKDFTISLLMDEIADAEEQYMMNLRAHVENIDSLIQMFHDRLDEMKDDNERQLDKMKAMAEKEAEEIRLSHQESEEYLKTMLYTLELARKEQEKTVRGDYLSKIDEENTKCTDLLQRLRGALENTFSNLWNSTTTFLKDYEEQTAERRKGYNVLREQDDGMQNLLKEQLLKIKKSQDYIKKLKQNFSDLQESRDLKISDLGNERQFFADAFWDLKTRLVSDRRIDNENLLLLTVKSGETIEYLKELSKKGEQILTLAGVCRKLETQEEKILPFPIDVENLEEAEKILLEQQPQKPVEIIDLLFVTASTRKGNI